MEALRKIIDKSSSELTIALPEAYQNIKLEVIISPADDQAGNNTQPETAAPKKYDFSDFAGKLQWQGDALAEQRKLRDEWD